MAGEIYIGSLGAVKTIRDSGGDAAFQFSSLANAAAWGSDKLDLGNWPRTRLYRWSCGIQWTTAATANRSFDFYYAGWDDESGGGSIPLGSPGASSATLTATKRLNMSYLGSVRVETSAVGPFVGGGLVDIPYRYITLAGYNDGGVALAAVGTYAPVFRLTPIIEQIQ